MLSDLVLFRHGKAVRAHEAADDFSRGLTERGKAQARAQALALQAEGLRPDVALVSTAQRAMETWQQAADIYDQTRLHETRDLYLASPDVYLGMARKQASNAADQKQSVILIAHDPGLYELARWLMKGAKDNGPGADLLALGFPTSGIAWFEADPSAKHGFRLRRFFKPEPIAAAV